MALPALFRTFQALKQFSPRYLLCLKETSTTTKATVKYFFNSSAKRGFYEDFFKVTPRNAKKLRLADGIQREYNLIYVSTLDTFLKYGYPVMIFGSAFGLGMVIFQYCKNGKMKIDSPDIWKFKMNNPEVEIWICVGGMILFALSGIAVMNKIPIRIYKHDLDKRYIAVYRSYVPVKIHQFHFNSASPATFKNPLMFFFKDRQYLIDGKKAILFDYAFRSPNDYFEMIGVD